MKTFIVKASAFSVFALVPAGFAIAASNPSGHGQPNQDCVSIVQNGGTEPGNGHAFTSPGSPFNEADLGGTGGTGGNAYNAAGAPSQYDVACYQATSRP